MATKTNAANKSGIHKFGGRGDRGNTLKISLTSMSYKLHIKQIPTNIPTTTKKSLLTDYKYQTILYYKVHNFHK